MSTSFHPTPSTGLEHDVSVRSAHRRHVPPWVVPIGLAAVAAAAVVTLVVTQRSDDTTPVVESGFTTSQDLVRQSIDAALAERAVTVTVGQDRVKELTDAAAAQQAMPSPSQAAAAIEADASTGVVLESILAAEARHAEPSPSVGLANGSIVATEAAAETNPGVVLESILAAEARHAEPSPSLSDRSIAAIEATEASEATTPPYRPIPFAPEGGGPR
jgi:hypothetical protein